MKAVGDIRLEDGLSTVHLYVRNGPVCATTFKGTIVAPNGRVKKSNLTDCHPLSR